MPSAPSDDLSSLWNFSLAVYARAGVADVCLRLQDEHGANVNLLLWCAWLGAKGYSLNQQQLLQAQHKTQSWDENYVKPLRELRRKMKAEFGVGDVSIEAVRSSIKQAELQAERQLQFWLEQIAKDWIGTSTIETMINPDSKITAIDNASKIAYIDAENVVRENILLYLSCMDVLESSHAENLIHVFSVR